jgi:hypothetical protein
MTWSDPSRSRILVLAVVAFHVLSGAAAAQPPSLDENAQRRWKEFEAFSACLQAKVKHRASFSNGKSQNFTYVYRHNPSCQAIFGAAADAAHEQISLRNPAYKAELRRNLSDPSKVLLTSVEQWKENKQPEPLTVFFLVAPHFTYWDVRLTELVSSPDFQVKGITKETVDGRELVRIEHRTVMEQPRKRFEREGAIFLDPARYWCISHVVEKEKIFHDGKLNRTATWDIRYELKEHKSGFPLVQSTTQKYAGVYARDGHSNEGTVTREYEYKFNDRLPTTDFTLTAYGLPEPHGVKWHKPTPVFVWILLAAGICGLLAVMLRWLGGRSSSRARG